MILVQLLSDNKKAAETHQIQIGLCIIVVDMPSFIGLQIITITFEPW